MASPPQSYEPAPAPAPLAPTSNLTVTVCIPTLRPGRWSGELADALARQTQPATVLVIDSGSPAAELEPFEACGARIERLGTRRFDHGGTRNSALDLEPADVHVFLTQDAVPSGIDALARLVASIEQDGDVGLAYGRQQASVRAAPRVVAHRLHNYPPPSVLLSDTDDASLPAGFASNAWAAYRREALEEVGRFPSPVVSSEDRLVAVRLTRAGWSVRYVADSIVIHDNEFTVGEELRRYHDIGVAHGANPWYEKAVGGAARAGVSLTKAEIAARRAAGERFAGARAWARAAARYGAFRVGRLGLPDAVGSRLSANPAYWESS